MLFLSDFHIFQWNCLFDLKTLNSGNLFQKRSSSFWVTDGWFTLLKLEWFFEINFFWYRFVPIMRLTLKFTIKITLQKLPSITRKFTRDPRKTTYNYHPFICTLNWTTRLIPGSRDALAKCVSFTTLHIKTWKLCGNGCEFIGNEKGIRYPLLKFWRLTLWNRNDLLGDGIGHKLWY